MLDTGLSMTQALKNILIDIKGIYNIIIQTPAGLYLMRDRFGVRPFYYGTKTNNIIVCGSESVGFGTDTKDIKEVGEGEIMYIGQDLSISNSRAIRPKYIHKIYKLPLAKINSSFCIFELFYFMNHNSILEDTTLYDIRFKFGTQLANNDTGDNILFTQENTIVVGSPNSGIAAGEGYALFSGLNYVQCIKKIRRTFYKTK